ncbi:MAG: sulfatase-like hydrolase/transferase [Rubrobacter sp.]|nr:sulfatase-like hydrolase/transferase [Rubrobacter sp.]
MGDWVYLALLFAPLFLYTTAFRVAGILVKDDEAGIWRVAGLLNSDLMFALGYAVFWVGVFAVFRSGLPRIAAAVLLHVSAALIAVISTIAYGYLETTGTTLDYSVVTYYLATPTEATGAVSSESSLLVWALLAGAALYMLFGPPLLYFALSRRGGSPEAESHGPEPSGAGRSGMTRRRFIAAGAGAGAGFILFRESLFPPSAAGKGGVVSRSPVSNLIATGIEEGEMAEAASRVPDAADLSRLKLIATPRTRKRHVALIHLESTRYHSTTPYNKDLGTMPYLAELSKNSLLAERAYTTTPHTSKAVTSLHSGLYPHPDTDIIESRPGGIPARSLPTLLGEHGYKSAWFQSATEAFEDRRVHVRNFGYDHFAAFEDMDTTGYQMSNYLGYEDDIMLPPSREWLTENADSPTFVMYLGVTPHHEYRLIDRYGTKKFARGSANAMLDRYLNNVHYDDFWTRNIIEQYKELGIYEDTIFIVYGDHGEAFGEHGVKGHDGVPYEEGLRVPFVVHDPQSFDGGVVLREPIQLTDLPPTIADMLGFAVEGGEYPGDSFMRPLSEDRVLRFSCRPDLVSMARIEGFEKYIYHFGKQPEEFYDLRRDPMETRNLAGGEGGGKLATLREDLLEWHAKSAAAYEKGAERTA